MKSLFLFSILILQCSLLNAQNTLHILAPATTGSADLLDIAASPTGSTVIAVGNGVILQRTGASSSFRHMQTPGRPFQARSVAWVEGSIVILTGNTGSIYRSIDNGSTWTSVYSQSNSLHTITSKDGICVAAGEYGAIIISKDKGVTWTAIKNKTTETLQSVSIQGNTIRCAGNGGTIVTSSDAGATWRAAEGLVSDDLRFITFLDDSKGFIGGTSGTLYSTTTGGKSWTSVLIDTLFSFQKCVFRDNSTGIAMGSTGSCYRTVDGGTTWTRENISGINQWMNSAVFNGTDIIAVGDEGTICTKSTSWTSNRTLSSGNTHFVIKNNASAIWVAGENGSIYRSDNNGTTWNSTALPQKDDCIDLSFMNTTIQAVTTGGTIYESADNGTSWSSISVLPNASLLTVFQAQQRIIVGGKSFFAYSDDGTHWTPVSALPANSTIYSIRGTSTGLICAVGSNGLILLSSNNGTSWTTISSGTTATLLGIDVLTDSSLLAAGEKGTILSSTDGGQTWKTSLADTLTWKTVIANKSSGNYILVSLEGEILQGVANQWKTHASTSHYLFNASIINSHLWTCGSDGYIAETELITGVDETENSVGIQFSIIPHPVAQDLVLYVESTAEVNITSEMYAADGRFTGMSKEYTIVPGSTTIHYPTGNLAQGTYFCMMRYAGRISVLPFTVVRR